MAWLNSDRPLNDEYSALKGRIVTLACILANSDLIAQATEER